MKRGATCVAGVVVLAVGMAGMVSGCESQDPGGDPQALMLTIPQAGIDSGDYTPELLFDVGVLLFEHRFSCAEGGGIRVDGNCVHDRQFGPEAFACVDCHNVPLRDGAGSEASNIFRGGTDFSNSVERNTPHLFGAGYVELVAEEMTAELAAARDEATARAASSASSVTVELLAKGVSFGRLTVGADGSTDLVAEGVDADLVVRPFMAKGFVTTLREQNLGAFPGHLGIQPAETVGLGVDGDNDGVTNELLPGALSAMVAYEAMLAAPSFAAVSDAAQVGAAPFRAAGCDTCHVPLLPLENVRYWLADPADSSQGFALDLTRDVELPRLARFGENGPVQVPLFSDLKRHDLGDELADPIDSNGVERHLFLTTRLWGVGSTAPYLHDGRAATIEEAIGWHGGEAASSRDAFNALAASDQQALLDFLESLVLQRGDVDTVLPTGVVASY